MQDISIAIDGEIVGTAKSINCQQDFIKPNCISSYYNPHQITGELKNVRFINYQKLNNIFENVKCDRVSYPFSSGIYNHYHHETYYTEDIYETLAVQKRRFDIIIEDDTTITDFRNVLVTKPLIINQYYETSSINFEAGSVVKIQKLFLKKCSFCKKSETEVSAIFEENEECICNECILQCVKTMRDKHPLWFYNNIQFIPDVCKRKIKNVK